MTVCNAVVKINNLAGTPTAIFADSANKAKFSVGKNGEFSVLSIIWDIAHTELDELMKDWMEEWFDLGGARTVSIYPNSKEISNHLYKSEFLLSACEYPIDNGIAMVELVENNGNKAMSQEIIDLLCL